MINIPPQAMSVQELDSLKGFMAELTDTDYLANRADGKTVVLSEDDRICLRKLVQELEDERQARAETYELVGMREHEILKLRKRLLVIQEFLKNTVLTADGPFGDGYSGRMLRAKAAMLATEFNPDDFLVKEDDLT